MTELAILGWLLAFGGWGAFWCIEDQVKELRAERDLVRAAYRAERARNERKAA